MIGNLDQLLRAAQESEPVVVAVAAAQDGAALDAAVDAASEGVATAMLFGERTNILHMLEQRHADASVFRIVDAPDASDAARQAVGAVANGDAQLLLKGKIKTGALLSVVLEKTSALRTGQLLSDVFVFENTTRRDDQLMMITDGGVVLKPSLEQKIDLIKNAVTVAHALGKPEPRVALLSAIESVNPNLPSTQEAAILAKMNQRGQITGCIVDGPLALDNAVSPKAARIKGIESPVAGYADILVCPDIESGNMLAKSTTYFAGFRLAHVIMGAAAPIMIPSRSDSAESKKLSIALGKLIYHARQETSRE